MKQDKIKDIISKKIKDIVQYCKEIDTGFDKDLIHDFRVTVKSLRSFLRLQKMHTGSRKIKLSKKFKRLYHIAGAIRETQLEIEHFEHTQPSLAHYLEKLYEDLSRQKKEWDNLYSKRILRKLGNKLAGLKYKTIHPDILEKFINNRMTEIGTITHKVTPTDIQVHTARKNIKDILYTSKIAGKQWKAAHKEVEAVPVKKLDKLADLIGNYNDDRIMLEHLNAFPLQKMDNNEKGSLKQLRGSETKKLHKKKKSLLAATRNFTQQSLRRI